jgi:hypothetical protein
MTTKSYVQLGVATMDLATASFRTTNPSPHSVESDAGIEQELAHSIRSHFRALATMLGHAAELYGDSCEGRRLRAAAAAAEKGQRSAERLLTKFGTEFLQ